MTEEDKKNDMVGYLQQSLYGTRDAASNFQLEVKKTMLKIGFRVGKYNPCTYYHPRLGIKTLVHGDDFMSVGGVEECQWLKEMLERRFEIKTKIVGSGENELKEERILNRLIRITADGWEYEADQRHADIIVEKLSLKGATGVKTPCEEDKRWQDEEGRELLDERDSRGFRELAARANYLAQDRVDIQFATKEICRGMCNPTKGDVRRLRRLGRYLITVPRVVIKYVWQRQTEVMTGFTDSDFAGCRQTAKSTSGGAIVAKQHWIKSWSSTQKTIALSSGEAELTALVKCSCELIGILQLAADWDDEMEGEIFVDSTAALGVVHRKGAGKLRHVRVGQLWVQEKQEQGELRYRKIKGTENPADALTKAMTRGEMEKYLSMLEIETRMGRADKGLQIAI